MTDDTPLLDLFCNPKPVKALIYLDRHENSYTRKISDAINTTYSHGVKLMARFQDRGLVESNKNGRKKEYTLTEDGQALAADFQNFIETCADVEDIPVEELLQPDVEPVW